jgi:predicted dehydrogenase
VPADSHSRIRVGLIGCGRIAQHAHLPALAALDGVEISALADLDEGRRVSCREQVPKAPTFSDYRELLERAEIEAMVICLPPALHAEAAIACFDRGLHVYLEKPIATTLIDGEQVVSAWKKAGTVGRIGFNCRFHPLAIPLRDALPSLGEISGVQTVFCAGRRPLPEWKRRRATGGGVLLDLASHHIDLIRFLFGREVAEIGAGLRSVESEDDTAAIELSLVAGPVVTLFASLAAVEEDRIEIYGSRGKLIFDRYRSSGLSFVPSHRSFDPMSRVAAVAAAARTLPRTLRDLLSPPRERSFPRSLAAFVADVRGVPSDGPRGADLDDGLRSLAVVTAAECAARTGRVITMAERDGRGSALESRAAGEPP